MIDLYIWIAVWVVILIMLIISLMKIESRIAEDRINKMFEYLKERKEMTMARHIDANKLEELCDIMAEKCDGIGESIWNQFRTMVECSPTVDVVEVVRCKDCKHSEHWYKGKRRCFLWHEAGIDVFEDGFCSYGERKEDGKIGEIHQG